MHCIMPLTERNDISYRIKCVSVENERIFDDVFVTQQTPAILPPYGVHVNGLRSKSKKKRSSLVHQVLESPDFMELNRKPLNRRRSVPMTAQTTHSFSRSKSLEETSNENGLEIDNNEVTAKQNNAHKEQHKPFPAPLANKLINPEVVMTSLVDQLLLDIYGLPGGDRGRSGSDSTASSSRPPTRHFSLQRARLLSKYSADLRVLVSTLRGHINHAGGLLIRQLRRRDFLLAKRDKQYDVITAYLQARSEKRSEDTRMKFSVTPQPGESGFTQWLDAMKMVARLPGGIPPEFRKRLWLTLAERHLQERGVDWQQAERLCFNEWSNPDDEELGIQIVKDLHRTGCSLFCGTAGRDNQAVLRRVLLGFARWNKSVGYCQGLNVLAALVLQVVDRAESAAVKVMIHLIEGVLPEGYFADNLRGLSVDMAVFRDLLRIRLPKLSRHLEALQSDAKDKATGSSYEPPLTNVFTMQWFLTLFCHCLPQEAVLRVWDLIFLEGDEVLLRTALVIWEGLAERIMTVTSADEFYSIMGVLTREMLEFTDTNYLIKAIVSTGSLSGVTSLREKHRYNITPWARRLSDDDETDTEEDDRLAVAAAVFGMSQRAKKDRGPSLSSLQLVAAGSDRDRLALDISKLKHQYAKLRERQRQAHIILSAACARQTMVPQPTSQAMNHLLVGKSALVSSKNRLLGPPPGAIPPRPKTSDSQTTKSQSRNNKQDVTLHWKNTKRQKEDNEEHFDEGTPSSAVESISGQIPVTLTSPIRPDIDSDSDSTSTELCDEPDHLSDVDSEKPMSTSDCYAMPTLDEESSSSSRSPGLASTPLQLSLVSDKESKIPRVMECSGGAKPAETGKTEDFPDEGTSIAEITDHIRSLSDNDKTYILPPESSNEVPKTPTLPFCEPSHTLQSQEQFQADLATWRQSAKDSSLPSDGLEVCGTNSEVMEKDKTPLDDYDFSDFKRSIVASYSSTVLIESEAPFEDNDHQMESPVVDIATNDSKAQAKQFSEIEKLYFDDEKAIEVSTGAMHSSISPAISTFARDSATLYSNESEISLDSSFRHSEQAFGSDTLASKKTTEESAINMSTTANLDSSVEKLTPYSGSYVIGYLPISPLIVDQKLSRMAEIPAPPESVETATQGTAIINFPHEGFGINININKSSDGNNDEASTDTFKHRVTSVRTHVGEKPSPKTPESQKSFSSGETMGPDSKTSSMTVSPRTPLWSESRDNRQEKSSLSSISSDSRTLALRSTDSDDIRAQVELETRKSSFGKSTPSPSISSDTLKKKLSTSPKLVVSSSSESYSPERKKSSERSFSSDLQSPISANSIKYTSNLKGDQENSTDSPINLSCATSPFYPISHPNKKTPSPHSCIKQKSSADSAESSPDQKSTSSKDLTHSSKYKSGEDLTGAVKSSSDLGVCEGNDLYTVTLSTACKNYSESPLVTDNTESMSSDGTGAFETSYRRIYRQRTSVREDDIQERYVEKDTITPLPQEKLEEHSIFWDRSRSLRGTIETKIELDNISDDCSKPFERSHSSLDKRYTDPKLLASTDKFELNTIKKRSSDILEDLIHLEAKTSNDGTSESSLMTKKTSDILEDLKCLEARRQDTFSDSASGFSKFRLGDSDKSILSVTRTSYTVKPKIDIKEGSHSILNSLTHSKDNNESDDNKESKLGVWTKVKPRMRSDNGRRSSDRALKIIQENSAILQKILTCQAKKRLPDLEEISKEITISPINEEISKIFSPILEKIGLKEHEINEELARMNLRDFDQMSMTSGSEFDAKIDDELSKLSLIDDSEEIDHLDFDDALSRDYLNTREALIDRQINEELSKLLANYEEGFPGSLSRHEKESSSRNASEHEGLDLSSVSTNVFSHKSSDDSIETKSEFGSIQESVIRTDKLYEFNDSVLPYTPKKYKPENVSPKSDIDIYRELEKLDKISAGEIFPTMRAAVTPEIISATPYVSDTLHYSDRNSPARDYSSKSEIEFVASPLESPYDSYKPYDFRSRISPRRTPNNPYSVRSFEKSTIDPDFELTEQKFMPSSHRCDLSPMRPIISKETLEFRVRYDNEPAQDVRKDDLATRHFDKHFIDLDKAVSYYDNRSGSPARYIHNDATGFDKSTASTMECTYKQSDYHVRDQESVSSNVFGHPDSDEYDMQASSYKLPSPRSDVHFGSHLTARRRESHSLSPNHQFPDHRHATPGNPYISNLSPSLEDMGKRPVSHPEFPEKVKTSKYADLSTQGSDNYKKSSLSLGNIGNVSKVAGLSAEKIPSPKLPFSPFPVKNTARKRRDLGLKLGLYSPPGSGSGQFERPP